MNYHSYLDKKIIITSKNFAAKQEYIIRFYETKFLSIVSLSLSAFNSDGSDTTKSDLSHAYIWSDILASEKIIGINIMNIAKQKIGCFIVTLAAMNIAFVR